MNRTFALLLASAVLLAHMLAIHVDAADGFAPPFEIAHVAFRLGRNFVLYGELAWDPGLPNVESYPSLLWVALATIPERLHIPVTSFCQVLSALCALVTTWVLARFSPERLAGVIAPLLFVTSGAAASAAASGTEFTLAGLMLTAAFLAYEHGRRWQLALYLSIACLTRPEAVGLTAVLFAIELVRRLRPGEGDAGRPSLWAGFAVPGALALVVCGVRFALSGHVLSPWTKPLTHFDQLPWREAALFLRDYFSTTAAAFLIVFPLWYLLRGALPGRGVRALGLTLGWILIATLGGGGPEVLPFGVHMVPILAILLVAVQEAMVTALDSTRAWMEKFVWSVFLAGLFLSALASKFPGDLGPLPTKALQERWMTAHTPSRFGYTDKLGREGLAEEIKATARLRGIGVFLRDHLDPRHSVLTPWPGAIGYISGLRVVDALSRATPMPGYLRAEAWNALERRDLIAALEQRSAYIVPTLGDDPVAPTIEDIVQAWSERLDLDPDSPERQARIRELLGAYEVLTVPASRVDGIEPRPGERYHLARRRELGLAPVLTLQTDARELAVQVEHRSHAQLADLFVWLEDPSGQRWFLRPDGSFVRRAELTARSSLLLHPTGTRTIELVRAALPPEFAGGTLHAVLANPGSTRSAGAASAVASQQL